MKSFKGTGASPGLAIGKPYFISNEIDFSIKPTNGLVDSIKLLDDRYDSLIEDLKNNNRNLEAEIIDSYKLILNDPEIKNELNKINGDDIKSIYNVFTKSADTLAALEDDYFRQRAEDITSIGKELIFTMQSVELGDEEEDNMIVLAKELTPNDTSSLNLQKVLGFIVQYAGPTSHAVIVAKNLGIPCVIGVDIESIQKELEDSIAINGSSGEVFLNPDEKVVLEVEKFKVVNQKLKKDYTQKNIDSLEIELRANIGSDEEINEFSDNLIESVGLFRSEFIYIDKPSKPPLEEQIKINEKLSSKFSKQIVFRTLDIGGDKEVSYLNLPKEENPFLGTRGIRYSLKEKKLFREQIISILKSSLINKVKIMFPMVSILEDFLKAKEIVIEEAEKLGVETPPLGIMVETPSAAINARIYHGHVDFFSIGTNDLIQYTYAADRGVAELNKYQDPLNPGVLNLISNVIQLGNELNIEVSVCGDMASDKEGALILYLLGLRIFSIAPSQAPLVLSSLLKANNELSHVSPEKILSQIDSQSVRKLIL